jgi:hypothetical protein
VLDRDEPQIFRKPADLGRLGVIVARQKHDSPAAMDGRVLGEDAGAQMVEAFVCIGVEV